MAPYVLTPTSEMGPDYLQADQVSSGGGGTTSISLSSADLTSGNEALSAAINQGVADASDSPVPSSEAEYKDAYIDGYKDGYTVAHVELKHQPIAIIGMSCRLPGGISTPDEFWELLARCRTGFSDIPPSRFSNKRFFHPNPGKSGCTNARGGNFLTQDLNAFDAPFFGFTQQEALTLDPQQRLLLECTFEVLENAGIPKHSIVGQDVGVFVGGSLPEREVDFFKDTDTIPMHQATGCAMAMQSNRISHFFDLRGPSYTVDTACSASLVALHNACQSLRTGESSIAIAAGVHLNLSPEFWISYSMSRLFGEEGRSFAFDRRGTGYGRGEGCGMILLKPLEQAIKDNDPIRAVITGTGLNQDGKTPGITMPNGSAQETLIRSIYSNGGMDPRDTGYVEAHGTGTRVGDPIEVHVIQKVFGEGRNKRKPLFIGSVKSNIGHLEAAAGIAGVIKTALMLERGFILPNYDFKYPNENIPFDEWGLKVATRQQPWPYGKKWASVNGFGFGGTNGHVVMTRGPLERKTIKEEIDTKASELLFVISANDKISAEKTMQGLGVYLEQRPEVFQNDLLGNLAYTLGQRRSFHPWRIAVTASTAAELVETLSNGKITPCKQDAEALRMGWIFTGQGAQWWAMGRELYQQYPVYASAIERADAHLISFGAKFSLLQELAKEEDTTQINAAYLSQPTCTAVQLALVNLLISWGLQPAAVVGHSSGEIGAAYAAGFITFEDAMTIAYHRGRLVPILKETYPSLNGCMMAVGAGKSQVVPLLDQVCPSLGQAKIACINSPASITISGDEPAVTELQKLLEAAYPGIFARKLQVDTAYHSHHMDLVAKQYMEALQELKVPEPSRVRFFSSLLGSVVDSQDLDRSYWVQNLTCPVRFDEALQGMCQPLNEHKTGVNMLCELGPHAALQGPVKQTLKHIGGAALKIPYTSALARKKNAVTTTLAMAGMLFVKGAALDMGSINFPTQDKKPRVLVDMPRYNWNHSSQFLYESRFTKLHKYHDAPRHDIIGVLAPYSNETEPTWRNVVRLDDLPWLRQYQMQGVTMFPISGFLAMAVEAAAQKALSSKAPWDDIEVEDLAVKSPIMLSEEELEMTIILKKHGDGPDSEATHSFLIQSWSQSKGWSDNCTGAVSLISTKDNEVDGQRGRKYRREHLYSKSVDIGQAATECTSAIRLYTQLSKIGVDYGELFQGLEQCRASVNGAVAQIVKTDTSNEMPHHYETDYILHPAFMEQLVSLYWPVIAAAGETNTVHLPASIGRVTVSARALSCPQKPGSALHAVCRSEAMVPNNGPNRYDMFAVDAAGEPIITIQGLSTSPIVEHGSDAETTGPQELCYKLDWEPVPEEEGVNEQALHGFDAEIVIIHGKTKLQYKLVAALTEHLEATLGTRINSGTLEDIAPIAQGKLCLVLTELASPLLATLDAAQFEALKMLLTTVQGALWVVQGAYHSPSNPETNMISGFSRTLRSEGTLANFVTLDLDPQDSSDPHHTVQTITRVLHMTLGAAAKVEEKEFRAQGRKLFTPRVLDDSDLNAFVHEQVHPAPTEPARFRDTDRPLRASLGTPGAVETLVFHDDGNLRHDLPDSCVDIAVKAVGISPTDLANGARLGMECSGTVIAVGSMVLNLRVGDRVAAIVTTGCLSNVARVQSQFVFKAPAHMSFEALATMPVAYCTAVYALMKEARLAEGESILIHDAASAVGQAALTLASRIGASVWVTVKTAEEKETIMQHYSIPQDRIWFSGVTYFSERIQSVTKGAGVDVVFNTLTDYRILRATWASIAQFGQFFNVMGGQQTTLHVPSATSVTVYSIDFAALAAHRPSLVHRTLSDVARMVQYGQLRPLLNIASYDAAGTVAALQNISALQSNERSVIVFSEEDYVTAPRIEKPSTLLRKDATYILIGGTGGLGRSIAAWMVSRGAQHIVLLSRSGTVRGAAAKEIEDLRAASANILVRSCDVSDREAVDELIDCDLSSLPPIRGVIHGAMVLDDVLFESMTHAQYTAVVTSKLHGAQNFHADLASHKNSTSNLDFFILISSAAGAVGNRGQAAYAAANTFLNGYAQHLRAAGLNASSLDLTAVSDAGYLAADAAKAAEVMRNLGSDTMCLSQVLALVHAGIAGRLESCNGHPITGMRMGVQQGTRPFWQHDAKFKHLVAAANAADSASSSDTTVVPWSARFRQSTSRAEAQSIVAAALVEKIAEVLSMEQAELDTERNLSAYPLDSLTAIEVRNFITRVFESNLQVLELLASGSIRTLAGVVVGKTKVVLPA